MSECPNRERNEEKCNCPSKDCPRHGVCCECIAQHRSKGNLPMCLR
ncbi:MAG: hypothetical protein LBP75_11520 [Planctomycetota bacterium]|jgi:hypothetical protein|nr:hypothetical protein [Planctomycetota bacterium]